MASHENTRRPRGLAGAAAAALIAALWSGQALAQGGPPPQVTVAPPLVQELIEYQEFTGQFSAVDTVEIRARVSGYLDEIAFADGQMVEEGDLLIRIDQRPFRNALDAANARLAQAEAQIVFAESELERAERLVANGNISRSVYDERLEQRDVAVQSAEVAAAEVASAELDLEFTEIRAPIAGRIGERQISVGNLVIGGSSASTSLLGTIVSIDPMYFEFEMSERYFLQYQRAIAEGRLPAYRDAGVPVEARFFDRHDDWSMTGTLDFIDNRVDRTSGTIRMRAVFPNPDGFVTPGQFGVLRMPASPRYAAVLLPDEAVLSDQDQRIVYTLDENNVVVPRAVRPGPTELGLRIIRRGLEGGERIIINGHARVQPGQEVTPVEGEILLPEPYRSTTN